MRADWTALPIVFFAAILVAGEGAGFMLSRFAGLWAWAAAFAILMVCVTVGWRVRHVVHLTVFAVGVALAWHMNRKGLHWMNVQEYCRKPVALRYLC